ncbi:DNA-binding GntR family transcriptional regulator [Actinocorallia herbida]|uniref:DNA-binding GntR family transcriptional regulator n=1 Tax=Actinocorallia herbida TaxID=58109 RepID=A0A3N1CVW5_9ACTN|nr:GntR family transcriptional regulator [Actinocorallia herbida]ROO85427.1 DNA-binding GntR family transcriptional regulator [Actinocorallia herbida]
MTETPHPDRLTHYWQLRQDILDGAFPRDSPLLETSLSARYGTSRAPIREALGLLEHDGLIERAVRGYRVRSGRPEDVVEIYEARIALEAEAAGAAALRRTDLDLARLARQHDLCRTAPDDATGRAGHFRFHEALWQAAHNVTITSLLERLTTRLRIYDSGPPASYGDPDLLNAEHEQIMAALRARDAETARAEMRGHLQRSLDLRIQSIAEEN